MKVFMENSAPSNVWYYNACLTPLPYQPHRVRWNQCLLCMLFCFINLFITISRKDNTLTTYIYLMMITINNCVWIRDSCPRHCKARLTYSAMRRTVVVRNSGWGQQKQKKPFFFFFLFNWPRVSFHATATRGLFW